MRKLLIAGLFIFMSSMCMAKAYELETFKAKVILPLSNVDITYMYDYVGNKHLLGGQTPIVKFLGITGNFAYVTDKDGNGSPSAVIDVELPKKYLYERWRFGAYIMYDFRFEEKRAGVKSSIRLW